MKTSEVVRKIAARGQYGRPVAPAGLYLTESYTSFYWEAPTGITFDQWKSAVKLLGRYRRFRNYVLEILPQWKEVKKIYWADNSVDSVQVSVDGRERRVMIAPPSGDLCY